jgi:hypothetical protein
MDRFPIGNRIRRAFAREDVNAKKMARGSPAGIFMN